jgi:hypothetical protein
MLSIFIIKLIIKRSILWTASANPKEGGFAANGKILQRKRRGSSYLYLLTSF